MNGKNVIVVGGGASGMLCALALAEGGKLNVTLLERGERLGRKLSATGNGQGNISNVHAGSGHYFTDNAAAVEDILKDFGERDLVGYFTRLGGLFDADDRGRVYPTGRQASAVTDLLRFALARTRTKIITGVTVTEISLRNKEYVLRGGAGETFTADTVVLATGGKAAKNFGTDGTGYALARLLGHSVTPLYPALVQLKTDTTHIKGLKGIRADCTVRAYDGERELATTRGDVIFTDYGVSGNAIFWVSSYLTDAAAPKIVLEFLPDVEEGKLAAVLKEKGKFCEKEALLGCILNNQIGRAVMKRLDVGQGGFSVESAVKLIKNFSLRVTGTAGFDSAQVTRGGIPMSEVNGGLMSKKSKNLYLCGEILNVDGECGGYNLQWAFSSGMRVAKSILRGTEEKA